jgi:hypothetical protein
MAGDYGNYLEKAVNCDIIIFKFYIYLYRMTTLTLNVPDALEKAHDDTVQFLAAKLYEAQKLSLS